jgi:transcription elongation factor GreA
MTTAQTFPNSARLALATRLHNLKALRDQAKVDSTPQGASGDAADRAENVEALIRLEDLETKIASLELKLQSNRIEDLADEDLASSSIPLGSRVQVSFDDDSDPETFVIGPVELASAGVDVITPASPLGTALLKAKPGDIVTYRGASGSTLSATLLAVE